MSPFVYARNRVIGCEWSASMAICWLLLNRYTPSADERFELYELEAAPVLMPAI